MPLQQKCKDSATIRALSRFDVPPRTECLLPIKIPRNFSSPTNLAIIEPHAAMYKRDCLLAKAVICLKSSNRQAMCRILNPMDRKFVIQKVMILASIAPVEITPREGQNLQDGNYKSQDKAVTSDEKIELLTNLGLDVNRAKMTDNVYYQFIDLLYKYQDIFARSIKDLTGSNILECPILTYPDAKPFCARPYRLTDDMRREVDKQLDEMLESGIIAESDGSQFTCPIVMARKANNEWRFCVDMRRLNAVSYPLFHELPLIEDVVDLMSRNKVQAMTVLDMRSSFHQIKVTPETSSKTTFITPHRGAYKYLRLPMGHSQSPYYMSMALNKLFRFEINSFLCVYLDDILLVSPSHEKHLEHLQIVFQKLRDANLKLHPTECRFMLDKFKYLGHIFSPEGVQADPAKTEVVQRYPTPKSVKEVRAFLGLVNYFRKSISYYSDRVHALTKLLQKDTKFYWGEDQERSFQDLKEALVSPPIMTLPDFSQMMILTTDASDVALSFNLSQMIDGREKFIAYGARGLRKSEKKIIQRAIKSY